MSLRQLLRKPNSPLLHRPLRHQKTHSPYLTTRRLNSSSSEAQTRTRIDRVLNRFPRFLHPYTNGLRNAPVTHVVSFLILHEITAVVPLVGLAGLFHWTGWIPDVSTVLVFRLSIPSIARYEAGRLGEIGSVDG